MKVLSLEQCGIDSICDMSAEKELEKIDEKLSGGGRMSLTELVRLVMANEMNPREKKVLELFSLRGLPAESVAQMTDMDRRTVYKVLGSAKSKLEKSLKYLFIFGMNNAENRFSDEKPE